MAECLSVRLLILTYKPSCQLAFMCVCVCDNSYVIHWNAVYVYNKQDCNLLQSAHLHSICTYMARCRTESLYRLFLAARAPITTPMIITPTTIATATPTTVPVLLPASIGTAAKK